MSNFISAPNYTSNVPGLVVLSSDDEDDDITFLNSPSVNPPAVTSNDSSVSANSSTTSLINPPSAPVSIHASQTPSSSATPVAAAPVSNYTPNVTARIPGLMGSKNNSGTRMNVNFSPNPNRLVPTFPATGTSPYSDMGPKRQKLSTPSLNPSASIIDLTGESDSDNDDDIIIMDPQQIPNGTKFKNISHPTSNQNANNQAGQHTFQQISQGAASTISPSLFQQNTTMNGPTTMNTFTSPPVIPMFPQVPIFNQPAPVAHFNGANTSLNQVNTMIGLQRQTKLANIKAQKDKIDQAYKKLTNESRVVTKKIEDHNKSLEGIRKERFLLARQKNDSFKPRILDIDRRLNVGATILRSYTSKSNEYATKIRSLQSILASLVSEESTIRMAIYSEMARRNESSDDDYDFGQDEMHSNSTRMGYTSNIYSSNDERSIQDLLKNIKTDEELEKEGLANTPSDMTVSLMRHQRMGLSWLLRMEESTGGGILADDMGLGKTVQAISLMLANRSKDDACKTNLVVAPVALLKQWAAEIESKVNKDAKMDVRIYHAAEKKSLYRFREIANCDVILTSYGTLSSEMKKHYKLAIEEAGITRNSSIIPDAASGGDKYVSPFFSSDATFYRVFLDEAQWIKNKTAQASKAVALLKSKYRFCLSGTPMQNSVDELYPLLRFLQIKPYDSEQRFRQDIVLPLKSKTDNYDEIDKGRAIKKLQALLQAILLRRTKDSKIDDEPILTLPNKLVEETYVVMETEEKSFYESLESSSAKKAEKLLNQRGAGSYSNVLTLLLRLRQSCCHNYLVKLGEQDSGDKDVFDWKGGISRAEKYASSTIRRINSELSDSTESQQTPFSCPICFDVSPTNDIMLLHPCGHGICKNCVDDFYDGNQETEDVGGKRIAKCKICNTLVKEGSLVPFTLFDQVCNQKMSKLDLGKLYDKPSKSISRKEKVMNLIKEEGGKFSPSAKINKAMELLDEIKHKYPGEKVIIFSQFTLLFELMHFVLNHKQIPYLRYDGSMSIDQRNETIRKFYQEDREVLLISLKAGNVGLTLTCASHVIIMDPFWNPFVEDQAMDRAHRIGQQRDVFVYRILIEGTVESRIMELQKKKKDLVNAALDENGMKTVSNLGRKELGFLFGLNRLDN